VLSLGLALCDCGIVTFAIVGMAMEIGIEPTVRPGADLGCILVVIQDVCGFGRFRSIIPKTYTVLSIPLGSTKAYFS
jgi:hypothetical protein